MFDAIRPSAHGGMARAVLAVEGITYTVEFFPGSDIVQTLIEGDMLPVRGGSGMGMEFRRSEVIERGRYFERWTESYFVFATTPARRRRGG
ncbi:hypothetical protein [Pseudomonas phage Itty13]|uniref:Uncharacterized protein n=1 Tax=Pseudomonas phage Itty13 TaxID=2805750 RepID=A0A889IQR8_9CAUD|nr:hypothetical protein PQC19_gp50 [Pseudomonas phage Itty13]QRE00626.1 hypothetical protein [Pseudomonas phage Itty13]